MYINHCYFERFHFEKSKMRRLSSLRIKYYQDMYKRYGLFLDLNNEHYLYPYAFLSKALMKRLHDDSALIKPKYLLLPKHGFTWEDGFISPELYLKEQYRIKQNILDVKDCGALCVYRAIEFALKMQEPTVVVSIENDSVFQANTFIGSLSLSAAMAGMNIYHLEFFDLQDSTVNKKLKKIIENLGVSLDQVSIFDHKNASYLFESAYPYHVISRFNFDSKKYAVLLDGDINLSEGVFMILSLE